jgi:response regulator RpfG family c-di-GMP phosphodiesterase
VLSGTEGDVRTPVSFPGRRERSPHRILVVDDEPDNLALVTRVLHPYYTIATASDGLSAIEQVAATSPDLVICDQHMPGLIGSEVLQRVRVMCPQARRMIISAFASADDLLAAINTGEVERYLLKPFEPNDLLAAVAEILAELDRWKNAQSELELLRRERDALSQREQELLRANAELVSRLKQAAAKMPAEEVPAPAKKGQLPTVEEVKSAMTRELKRAARYSRPLSLVLARFGPPELPQDVMIELGQLAQASFRDIDIAARLDDQALVVLLPETERESAQRVGARFKGLAERATQVQGIMTPVVRTGVASFPVDGLGLWGLLAQAGRLLAEVY